MKGDCSGLLLFYVRCSVLLTLSIPVSCKFVCFCVIISLLRVPYLTYTLMFQTRFVNMHSRQLLSKANRLFKLCYKMYPFTSVALLSNSVSSPRKMLTIELDVALWL